MMENLLRGGDYVPDGFGGFVRLRGDEKDLQRALYRLTCRRGAQCFLPRLGSRLYRLGREKTAARDQAAMQMAAEALADMDGRGGAGAQCLGRSGDGGIYPARENRRADGGGGDGMKEVSELYRQMLDVFTEKTGFSMDDSADLAVRLYAAAAQLQTLYIYADWALAQSFPQTAEGEYLDRHAALRGIARKDGEKAHGVLRFRVELAREDDLTIPAGTVCSTAGLVRFVTLEDAVIAAGDLYADAPAQAESAGSAGNTAAGTVTVMTQAPVGVAGVTNPAAFTGGTDGETDAALRERVLGSFIRLPNGANAAFYEQRALAHAGVRAASVIPRENGIGTVGVVIAAEDGVPSEALVAEVQADIQKVREIAVDVTVRAPSVKTVAVTAALTPKAGASFDEAKAAVTGALAAYFGGGMLGRSVYRAALGNVIYGTGLVENYRLSAPASDIAGAADRLPVLGTLRLTEAAV